VVCLDTWSCVNAWFGSLIECNVLWVDNHNDIRLVLVFLVGFKLCLKHPFYLHLPNPLLIFTYLYWKSILESCCKSVLVNLRHDSSVLITSGYRAPIDAKPIGLVLKFHNRFSVKNSAPYNTYPGSYAWSIGATKICKTLLTHWLHYFISWAIDLRLRKIQLEKFRNFMGIFLSKIQKFWLHSQRVMPETLELLESVSTADILDLFILYLKL
jgi:hypothetical protein